MSNNIVSQVDVGSLSIRGLAAFTPLLSALSADDVAPLTMIQLENLGSPFHVNGPYALMVPDLLRRYSSVRMDRIGIMIGWRKGDTPSLLAQSAGGQAVALLCFCLANTCKYQDIGVILNELSERILPTGLARSSISQLTAVADLLAAKLQVIGFGNMLAKHVLRIQEAYSHIGKKLPFGFFDFMTVESVVELYEALSKLSSEESTVLRISGTHAMAHIIMIVLIMFPDNAMITAESLIIQQGHSPSIYLDISISEGRNCPTRILVEQRLNIASIQPILVEVFARECDRRAVAYHFQWAGHITDALRIAFAEIGAELSDTVVEACCDLLLGIVDCPVKTSPSPHDGPGPLNGYLGLLGSEPTQRCYHVCRTVFGATPSDRPKDFHSAYSRMYIALSSVTGSASHCTCTGVQACSPWDSWEPFLRRPQAKSVQNCLHRMLWRSVLSALNRGYDALLVDVVLQTTIKFDIAAINEPWFHIPSLQILLNTSSSKWSVPHYFSGNGTHRFLMSSYFNVDNVDAGVLVVSDGSATMYPAFLNDLKIDIDEGVRYSLCEGQLYVKGRRYRQLQAIPCKPRESASKSLNTHKGRISPSSLGEHSHIAFTIRETLSSLELRSSLIVRGHSIQLDLHKVLCCAMGLNDAPECDHNPKNDLAPELQDDVLTTSVATPKAKGRKISIVQTKDNPTAQLLACGTGGGLLLQRKCCLNCAVLYAKANELTQVIVAS